MQEQPVNKEVLTGPVMKKMKRLARGIKNGSVSVLIRDGKVTGVQQSVVYCFVPTPTLSSPDLLVEEMGSDV